MVASALAFGETRRIKRTETRRDCWKISEKGASAHLRAVARFKIAKKGRCDAEDAADEIRRETIQRVDTHSSGVDTPLWTRDMRQSDTRMEKKPLNST